jgi:hypothetical protein
MFAKAGLQMVKGSRTNSLALEGRGTSCGNPTRCARFSANSSALRPDAKQFRRLRKVSSIMRAKVLSIMSGFDLGLTSLFKWIGEVAR